jgi:2-dehydropantoate 2-reductase
LAQSSAKNIVSVVCRSNYERVLETGYQLQTKKWGSASWKPHRVHKAVGFERHPQQHFDYIILANKITNGHAGAIRDLQALVNPQTTLVAAQNGMDVEVPIQRAFPGNTVLTAICNVGCNQANHGVIVQDAHIKKHAFLIGVHGQGRKIDLHRRDALVSMDSEFDSIDCVLQERWRKLIFNSAWNSTTALTGLDTHQLLQHPSAILIVAQLAREAYDVAIASGIELDPDLPNKTIELARIAPAITPSTLQDARSKRPMELTPIFGYICQQAARVGTAVPTVSNGMFTSSNSSLTER